MNIKRLDPDGLIKQEVSGVSMLETQLPDQWFGFSNLLMRRTGREQAAEIDIVIVTHDRVIIADLKDWAGNVVYRNGNWYQNRRDRKRSAAKKIGLNARILATRINDEVALPENPFVEGFVIFTNPSIDYSDLLTNDPDCGRVLGINDFLKLLKTHHRYDSRFRTNRHWTREFPLTARDPRKLLQAFFGNDENFGPADVLFDNFKPVGTPTFEHPSSLYKEFSCELIDDTNFTALLRYWDFSVLDARTHVPETRKAIASRELAVQGFLNVTDAALYDSAIMKSKSRDSEFQMHYWELFDLGRSMRRVSEYLVKRKPDASRRRDISSMLMARLAQIHRTQVAHRDIGKHSVWYDEQASSVVLSGFGAAYYPERKTIADFRSVLSAGSVKAPEDATELRIARGTPYQIDVFQIACLVYLILTDLHVPLLEGYAVWDDALITNGQLPNTLSPWFAKALAWNPQERFTDGVDLHEAFLGAYQVRDESLEHQDFLARFIQTRRPFIEYPPTLDLESEEATMWLSEKDNVKTIVKMWPRLEAAQGTLALLAVRKFLTATESIKTNQPDWLPKIRSFGISSQEPYLAYYYTDGPLIEDFSHDDVDDAYDFCCKLVKATAELHSSFGAHGDLSPRNIVVANDAAGATFPVFLDFPSLQNSKTPRSTPAYSPLHPAEPLVRDRFALAKIVSECLIAFAVDQTFQDPAGFLLAAAMRCLSEDDGGLTLRPMLSAIELGQAHATMLSTVTMFTAPNFPIDNHLLLANDGVYSVVTNSDGNKISVYGFDEQIEILYDRRLCVPIEARLVNALNAQRYVEENKAFSFRGEVHVTRGQSVTLNSFTWLWAQEPLKQYFSSIRESEDKSLRDEPDASDSVILVTTRTPEIKPLISIDVEELWKATLDVDDESHPEAIVTGASSWDPLNKITIIPCEFSDPDAEFDNTQPLELVLEGRIIGEVAVDKLTSSELPIFNKPRATLDPGTRLAIQSRSDFDNQSRRRRAIRRILNRESVIASLIDYFKHDCNLTPLLMSPISVNDADIAKYNLNDIQQLALRRLWSMGPLGILQGPPGTGKTAFIASFVHFALTKGEANNILLVSQSHAAVNNAVEKSVKLFGPLETQVSLLRVGQISKVSESLIPFHSDSAQGHYREMFEAERKHRISLVGRELGCPDDFLNELFEALERNRHIVSTLSHKEDDDSLPSEVLEHAQADLQHLRAELGINDEVPYSELISHIPRSLASKHGLTNPDMLRRLLGIYKLSQEWSSALAGGRSLEQFFAKSRSIVSGTCVGIGKRKLGIDSSQYDVVIIDEAAKCSPSDLAIAMQVGKKVLLVGDHKQLPPFSKRGYVRALMQRFPNQRKAIELTDFERALSSPYGKLMSISLKTQYRMAKPICDLISHCFYSDEPLETGRGPVPDYFSLLNSPLDDEITWIDTSHLGVDAHEASEGPSKSNRSEAEAIIKLLRQLSSIDDFWHAYDADKPQEKPIGIITMYVAQKNLINKYLVTSGLKSSFLARIKVDTVDSYQGQENAIIFLSIVRNNSSGDLGYIKNLRRINVALSRAMERLIVVGSTTFIYSVPQDNPLGTVIDYLRSKPSLKRRIINLVSKNVSEEQQYVADR